ncbi:hypothetical protein A2415_04020 [candidate division WWE3 bacterium RIFOXYC1_FULL_39_7]|uniref:Uncharacterized protein n=2 Tax=Katanobacteria TaxID=422282 RepID=A0A1F4X5R2_UNCKA|nr:MAG: hypothetical protein A2415_04020 [candidate division WWE3 bacterium RIFOXYC1_FULL_39_7]OGC77030.1 MAG: hypothetical protein A2619_03635 [candidate division WWE3 bacterium RIFOXYD1_FULL_39_9]
MPLADLPQTNKQHAVPQNIMDVEFKLIGDLTMRQFAYLMICGGISYLATVTVAGIFKWPVVIFFTLLGLGLAFIPIQERGLDEWIVNFFKAIYSPTQRIWKKEPTVPSAFMYENIAVVRQEMITLAPTSSRRKLEDYLEFQLKEEKEDPLDIPEKEYIMKVRQMVGIIEPAAPAVSVTYEEEAVEEVAPVEPPLPGEEPETQPEKETGDEKPQEQPAEVSAEPKPVIEKKRTPADIERKSHKIRVAREREARRQTARDTVAVAPLTPDMHAGRKFVNLLPYGGELVLPIRGEKVIQTSEQLEIEDDIQEKADRLQKLLEQIKGSGAITKATQDEVKVTPAQLNVEQGGEVNVEAVEVIEELKQEKDRLSQEIESLKVSKESAPTPVEASQKEEMITKLQTEKERTQSDYESLQRQILDLQNKLKEKEQFNVDTSSPSKPVYAKIQPLTSRPNVVSGIVKKQDGTVMEGVLLIIKNQKGEAVRALKSNTLGQFTLMTPLSNGMYTIEVSPSADTQTFDIISLEAKGDIIPPIEFVGK